MKITSILLVAAGTMLGSVALSAQTAKLVAVHPGVPSGPDYVQSSAAASPSLVGMTAQAAAARKAQSTQTSDEPPAILSNVHRAPDQNSSLPSATPGNPIIETNGQAFAAPVAMSPDSVQAMPPTAVAAGQTPATPAGGTANYGLRLELNELSLLRDAARKAGGDLRLSIQLINCTAEDLLVPLSQSGQVVILRDDASKKFIARSYNPEQKLEQERAKLAALEQRRRELLHQIAYLESLPKTGGNQTQAQPQPQGQQTTNIEY